MANPTWPNDEATYFLFVQQIHYERILKLDGDMRIFDINQIIPVIWGVSLYSETYFEEKQQLRSSHNLKQTPQQ